MRELVRQKESIGRQGWVKGAGEGDKVEKVQKMREQQRRETEEKLKKKEEEI